MKIELKNISEVSFFRIQGFEVVALRSSIEGQRKTVYFELAGDFEEHQFEQIRRDFLNKSSLVEPRAYAEAMKSTTDLLFEELRRVKK